LLQSHIRYSLAKVLDSRKPGKACQKISQDNYFSMKSQPPHENKILDSSNIKQNHCDNDDSSLHGALKIFCNTA